MTEVISANWVLLVLALLIGILVAWWVLASTRKTKVEIEKTEESTPQRSKRNQALMDAVPSATPPATPLPEPANQSEPMQKSAPVVAHQPPAAVAAAPALSPMAATTSSDDLTRIKGVGPKLSEQLVALGITTFAQVAAWNDSEIDRIDAQLGRFQGRIRRDDWPEQARLLLAGDTAGYESRFGKL